MARLTLRGEDPNPGRPSYMPCMGWFGRGSQDLPCQICDCGIPDTRRVAYQMLAYQSIICETVAHGAPVAGIPESCVWSSGIPADQACDSGMPVCQPVRPWHARYHMQGQCQVLSEQTRSDTEQTVNKRAFCVICWCFRNICLGV